jgi:hypothetical protein
MHFDQFWKALVDSYNDCSDLTNNKICVAVLNEVLTYLDDAAIQ